MDFHSLKRKELQALCKQNQIRANSTNLEMANNLTLLFKEKEKEIVETNEVLTETESSNVVVSKNVKKVRFSPENEVIEFTRSHKFKRSRRSMVLCRKSNLSVENVSCVEELNRDSVDRNVKTRLRGKKTLECVDNGGRRGGKKVSIDGEIEGEETLKENVGRTVRTRSRGNAVLGNDENDGKEDGKEVSVVKGLKENVDNGRKRGRPRRVLVDKIENQESVGKTEDMPDEIKVLALTENVDNGRKRGRKKAVVDKVVNHADVVGNDENGVGNRRSLRSKGIVSDGNLAIGVGTNNDGKGKEEALVRVSKRGVSTVGSSNMVVEEATDVGAEVTGKGKVETVVQNQESEKVELRRSRRLFVMPSLELRNLETDARNVEVFKPGGVVRTSRRNKVDVNLNPVSSIIETEEQVVKPSVTVQKNTTRSKRHASDSLEVADEIGGDDIIQCKNVARKKKKGNVSKKDVVIDDSSHDTQYVTGVSDMKKPSSSMKESVLLDGSLQAGVTEHRESLAAQLSVPKVTSGSEQKSLSASTETTKLNPEIQDNSEMKDSIPLTDMDGIETSRMKDLHREEDFPDVVAENANLTVESDVLVLNEEIITVADNGVLAAQMTSQTEISTFCANCDEVNENSNVCENEVSPDWEGIEAEAEKSIGSKADLLDLVSERKGVCAQENPCSVEPVLINDVSLPLGSEHSSDMELLVAPSPCHGTDTEKTQNLTPLRWSETENCQTEYDVNDVKCLKESNISPVQSHEDTSEKSGALKNSGSYDTSFDRCRSDDKDGKTKISGVSNISGDSMSMENIMDGEHEVTELGDDFSDDYTYEPDTLVGDQNCSTENEASIEAQNAHVESFCDTVITDLELGRRLSEGNFQDGEIQNGQIGKEDIITPNEPNEDICQSPNMSNLEASMSKSNVNSILLIGMDGIETSKMKDLHREEDFPDVVAESANLIVESDVRVLNKDNITVADNGVLAAQMTSQTEISTFSANSNEVSPDLEGIEAKVVLSIGSKADLLDLASAHKSVCAQENPRPVNPVFIDGVSLQLGREHGSDMELLVAARPCLSTDTENTHNLSPMRWSEIETFQTKYNLNGVDCLEESIISTVLSDTAEKSGISKNSGGYDTSSHRSRSEDKDCKTKISGKMLAVSNILGDNMSVEKIMDGEHEATQLAEKLSNDYTYEPATLGSNQNCSTENEASIEVESAHVENFCDTVITELELGRRSSEGNFQGTMDAEIQYWQIGKEDIITSNEPNEDTCQRPKSSNLEASMNKSTVTRDICSFVQNEELNMGGEKENECEKPHNKRPVSERKEHVLRSLIATPIDEASGSESTPKATSQEDVCTVKKNMNTETMSSDGIERGKGVEFEKVITESLVFEANNHEVLDTVSMEVTDETALSLLFATPKKTKDSYKVDGFCRFESKLEESCLEKVCSGNDENVLQLLFTAPIKEFSCEANQTCGSESKSALEECTVEKVCPMKRNTSHEDVGVAGLELTNNLSPEASNIKLSEEELGKNGNETDLRLPYATPTKTEAGKVNDICFSESNLEEFGMEKLFCTQQKASHAKAGGSYILNNEYIAENDESDLQNAFEECTAEKVCPMKLNSSQDEVKVAVLELTNNFSPKAPNSEVLVDSEIFDNLACPTVSRVNCEEELVQSSGNFNTENQTQASVATLSDNLNRSREEEESVDVEISIDDESAKLEVTSLSEGKFQDIVLTAIQDQNLLRCNIPTNVGGNLSEEEIGQNGQVDLEGLEAKADESIGMKADLLDLVSEHQGVCAQENPSPVDGSFSDMELLVAPSPCPCPGTDTVGTHNLTENSDTENSQTKYDLNDVNSLEESSICLVQSSEDTAEKSGAAKYSDGYDTSFDQCQSDDKDGVTEISGNKLAVSNISEDKLEMILDGEHGATKQAEEISNGTDLQLLFATPNTTDVSDYNESCAFECELEEPSMKNVAPTNESMKDEDLNLVNGLEVTNLDSSTVVPVANAFEASIESWTGETYVQKKETGSLSVEHICSFGQIYHDEESEDNDHNIAFTEPTSLEMADDQLRINVVTDQETGTPILDEEEPLFRNFEMHPRDSNYEISNCSAKEILGSSTDEMVSDLFPNELGSKFEVLEESDVMETIQEYTNYESSNSVDIDHSSATLPIKASTEASKISDSVNEPHEDSTLDEVSALRGVSTAKKTARTIMIHGTPNKALVTADMKENDPLNKKPVLGDITIMRPAKRRALQDI